jgi:hypothetical protein
MDSEIKKTFKTLPRRLLAGDLVAYAVEIRILSYVQTKMLIYLLVKELTQMKSLTPEQERIVAEIFLQAKTKDLVKFWSLFNINCRLISTALYKNNASFSNNLKRAMYSMKSSQKDQYYHGFFGLPKDPRWLEEIATKKDEAFWKTEKIRVEKINKEIDEAENIGYSKNPLVYSTRTVYHKELTENDPPLQ